MGMVGEKPSWGWVCVCVCVCTRVHVFLLKYICAVVPCDGVGVRLCAVPHSILVSSKHGGHGQEGPAAVQRRRMGLGKPASALSQTCIQSRGFESWDSGCLCTESLNLLG